MIKVRADQEPSRRARESNDLPSTDLVDVRSFRGIADLESPEVGAVGVASREH